MGGTAGTVRAIVLCRCRLTGPAGLGAAHTRTHAHASRRAGPGPQRVGWLLSDAPSRLNATMSHQLMDLPVSELASEAHRADLEVRDRWGVLGCAMLAVA